jgi:hypothetical protein
LFVKKCPLVKERWDSTRCYIVGGVGKRWKHTMVTPFGVAHCTTFEGCACFNVSHFKKFKEFHNIFAYYVRI